MFCGDDLDLALLAHPAHRKLRISRLCLLKTSSKARLLTFPRFGTSSPPLMIHLVYALLATARSSLRSRRELALENLALRQQLAVLKRSSKRPKLTKMDRAFWVALSRLWTSWPHALILENPTWRAPRIHGELLKLGFEVTEATVSRYMPRRRKPPSQSWRAFLRNHTKELVSVDFFVVPTATFRILYVFVVLEHERRRVVHFNVTDGPSARWTGQQLVNPFPYDSAPKYVIRDRDKIYGAAFVRRAHALGIEQILTAPRSPWQNPYCERVIGTLRRECLDHVIVLGEQHLWRILRKYLEYYHGSRTHLALDKDAPELRERESSDGGKVIALPMVGGLHHRYTRRAA